MRPRFCQYLALLLTLVLCFQACFASPYETAYAAPYGTIAEDVIPEDILPEKAILEQRIAPAYIAEHLICEDGLYEYRLTEGIISQAYTFEIVVGQTTEDDILSRLPADLLEYDIDWPSVIAKFAVGAVIIIAVGVVSFFTKGSTYFVFGSAAKVARDAFIGGVIGAALDEVINGAINGGLTDKAAAKYAIEGFAEGFMWGAISSVLKINSENFRRLKVFKAAAGKLLKIKADGAVIDAAGKAVGNAYYDSKGIWYLFDEAARTVRFFDSKGKEILGHAAAALTSTANALPANKTLYTGVGSKAREAFTDDMGEIFRIGDDLVPGKTFKLNGYNYTIDQLGRKAGASATQLRLKDSLGRTPMRDMADAIGKGYALSGDDRAHIIADVFGGDSSLANLVPMSGHINKSEYKKLENIWRKALNSGKQVSVSVDMAYEGASFRPSAFTVSYSIDGSLASQTIVNH